MNDFAKQGEHALGILIRASRQGVEIILVWWVTSCKPGEVLYRAGTVDTGTFV